MPGGVREGLALGRALPHGPPRYTRGARRARAANDRGARCTRRRHLAARWQEPLLDAGQDGADLPMEVHHPDSRARAARPPPLGRRGAAAARPRKREGWRGNNNNNSRPGADCFAAALSSANEPPRAPCRSC
eukprot:scaffold2330_cov376-Prasinococcus_capsulatus_cf.AAC.4